MGQRMPKGNNRGTPTLNDAFVRFEELKVSLSSVSVCERRCKLKDALGESRVAPNIDEQRKGPVLRAENTQGSWTNLFRLPVGKPDVTEGRMPGPDYPEAMGR